MTLWVPVWCSQQYFFERDIQLHQLDSILSHIMSLINSLVQVVVKVDFSTVD